SEKRNIADSTRKAADQQPFASLLGDRPVRVVVSLEWTSDIPAAAQSAPTPGKPAASAAMP
ncbi:MAG: hypothetical protein ACKO38_09735, partial [Planctomycetota bacterium]